MHVASDPVVFGHKRSRDINGSELTRQAARSIGWPHSSLLAEDGTLLLAEDYRPQEAEVGDQR